MITPEEVALSRRLADVFMHARPAELPDRTVFVKAYEQFREFDRLPLHLRERIVELEALAAARAMARRRAHG